MLGLARSIFKHVEPAIWQRTVLSRGFITTRQSLEKPLPPRIKIDDNDIVENFLQGSGPGGQKINKTSSAVQLIHKPTGIVVKCQATRSRTQNRKDARRLLSDRLEELEKGEQSRTAIKAAKIMKKKANAARKSRKKYRALEEAKKGTLQTMETQDDIEIDREAGNRMTGTSDMSNEVTVHHEDTREAGARNSHSSY